MQITLIFVVSLLLSLQQFAGSTAHIPPLTINSADDLRGQVCYRTAANVQDTLQNPLSPENIKDYPKKPSTGVKY